MIERTQLSSDCWQNAMRNKVNNAKDRRNSMETSQDSVTTWWTDTDITSESEKSERSDANTSLWQAPVPPNGKTAVTATSETRF